MLERTVNKNYMYNLELQSLHYWYKRAPLQNPSTKYDNILKIMQNSVYKTDIIDTSTQDFTNFIQRSRINFYDRVILRNVFEYWKMYVIHKLHTRKVTYKANVFYHKKLQKKVLHALSKNVLLKWKHIVLCTNNSPNKFTICMKYMKVEMHYTKILLRHYFTCWCKYITLKHRKSSLLGKAIIFDNVHCLRKYIILWGIYVIQQKQKKIRQNKIEKAHKFYVKSILQKCIRAWISICEFTFQKYKIGNAILHYNNKLLQIYFNIWKMYHYLKVQKLNTKEYIQEYSRKRLLKQYFEQFVMCVNESIMDKIAQEKVTEFYTFKCLQKTFSAWLKWHNKQIQKSIKMSKIKSILENKIKRTIFFNWHLYLYEKKSKRRKIFLSQNFYRKNLIIKVLRKLHDYTVYRNDKKLKLSYLNDKSEMIIQQLQNIFIQKWRMALYITVQEKRKLSQAAEFWERNLIRKYFFYWKEFSQQYKTKILHKEKLNKLAFGFLLKRYILHWLAKLQDVLQIRKKEIIITAMVDHKIMTKCWLSWKEYVIQKIKLKHDIEAAKELHEKFLLCKGLKEILRNSLCNVDYQYSMQLENAAMKSFENFEILKEYFDKWQSLIYLKTNPKFLRDDIKNNDSQLIHSRLSCDNMLNNIKSTNLVLPEYMKKKDTISTNVDLFEEFPRESWSFNSF